METQKTVDNQIEDQSWKNHGPWLQTKLQSYSHQDSVLLAQKETHKLVEQNIEPW